jgi:hypothetical protein
VIDCFNFCPDICKLTGGTPSAIRAESAENKLAFTNNSLAQRTGSRPGHVVPVDVLNIAAAITNEMVMARAFQVKSPGAALDGHLPH